MYAGRASAAHKAALVPTSTAGAESAGRAEPRAGTHPNPSHPPSLAVTCGLCPAKGMRKRRGKNFLFLKKSPEPQCRAAPRKNTPSMALRGSQQGEEQAEGCSATLPSACAQERKRMGMAQRLDSWLLQNRRPNTEPHRRGWTKIAEPVSQIAGAECRQPNPKVVL